MTKKSEININTKLWNKVLYGRNSDIEVNYSEHSLYAASLSHFKKEHHPEVKLMLHVIFRAAKDRDIKWLNSAQYLFEYLHLDYDSTMKLFANIWREEDESSRDF